MRAERDGKTVRVVTVEDDEAPPIESKDVDKYCLVADAEEARSLKEKTSGAVPTGTDLAVIGLDGEDYFVA